LEEVVEEVEDSLAVQELLVEEVEEEDLEHGLHL
jgi:hypothetical protein